MKRQKQMQLIYHRGGNVANSKFDFSLLKPVDEKNQGFDPSQLKEIEEFPEEEGFLSKLPRNILIGLANLGHSTLNQPHDIAKAAENAGQGINDWQARIRKSIYGEPMQQKTNINGPKLSDYIPKQQEYNFAEMLGQPGEGTLLDSIIQKGVEYAPEIASGRALLKGGIRRLKGTHQLDIAEKLAKESGLNFNYPEKLIKESRKFLPNTVESQEMIDAVRAGNYKPAFLMQSQVGHHQRKLLRSPLASENSIMAPKAGELKQSMLGHLEKVFRNANMPKEADLLKAGINNYRQYMKVKEAIKPYLKQLGIHGGYLALLGYGYKKGKKLLND